MHPRVEQYLQEKAVLDSKHQREDKLCYIATSLYLVVFAGSVMNPSYVTLATGLFSFFMLPLLGAWTSPLIQEQTVYLRVTKPFFRDAHALLEGFHRTALRLDSPFDDLHSLSCASRSIYYVEHSKAKLYTDALNELWALKGIRAEEKTDG